MVNPGDWSVTTDGRFHSMNPIPFGLTVTYRPKVISDIKDTDNTVKASWNVIPDPSTWTGNYSGIKISLANNTDTSQGYHIWLPPRKPLGSTKIIQASLESVSANIQISPDSGTLLAWQDSSVNASLTNGTHYRYNFPSEITGSSSSTLLPTSFVYIWDNVIGTILEGVLFYVPTNIAHSTFKLRVTGNDLINVFGDTIGNGILTDDTTQLPGDYISRFKIITVGTSTTKIISSLLKDHFNHRHTRHRLAVFRDEFACFHRSHP